MTYDPIKAEESKPKKRTKSTLPSTRVKRLVESLGYTSQMVERFVPGANRRYDFLGAIDILALKKGEKIVGIQTFTTQWQAHKRKIVDGEEQWSYDGAMLWLSLKNTRFIFIGFRKLLMKRGGTAVRWTPRFGKVIVVGKKKKKRLELIEVDTFEEAIK